MQVVTVSTSRFGKMKDGRKFTDESGDVAVREVESAGHEMSRRTVISDDAIMIRKEVKTFISGRDDILIMTGGTGVSGRDVTIETVRPFFQKELDGFGELLRRLSYDEIGSAAILTRATMGISKGKLIICLPGSPGAVQTAMKAALGELPHAVYIARS